MQKKKKWKSVKREIAAFFTFFFLSLSYHFIPVHWSDIEQSHINIALAQLGRQKIGTGIERVSRWNQEEH